MSAEPKRFAYLRYIVGGAALVVVSFAAIAFGDSVRTADDEFVATAPAEAEVVEPTEPVEAATATAVPTESSEPVTTEASSFAQVANTEIAESPAPLVDEFYIPPFAATEDRTATSTHQSAPDPTPTPAPTQPPPQPAPTPTPAPAQPTPTPEPNADPTPDSPQENDGDGGDDGGQDQEDTNDGGAQENDGGDGWPTPDQWAALRACESGGNYSILSPGGTYRGAYQFSQSTWDWVAGARYPSLVGVDPAQASPADQDAMAYALYEIGGWQHWPVCGRHLL